MKEAVNRTVCLLLLTFICVLALAAATPAQDAGGQGNPGGGNLLLNPDWENGIDGWKVLAENHTESLGDHEIIQSIVCQDVPVKSYMIGKECVLSGSIGLSPKDPTQEAIILAMIICGEDGYLLDGVREDGSFIYNEYVTEDSRELSYHELKMEIPDNAAFIRVSLEIRKAGRENRFNFENLSLTVNDKADGSGGFFVRENGAEDGSSDFYHEKDESSDFYHEKDEDGSHDDGRDERDGVDYEKDGNGGLNSEKNGGVRAENEDAKSKPDTAGLMALLEKGKGYYYGTGPEGYDLQKARSAFAEAAQGGVGEGWYYFANTLMNSIEDERYERALAGYQMACDYGFDLGLVGQAVIYADGMGIEADPAKAFELYSKAVELGFAEGCCGLGNLYKEGNGVPQDELAAMEYYKMALDSGDFMWRNYAKIQIGKLYYYGAPGIAQDYQQAMKWFKAAADEGYGMGHVRIGDMYYNGNGVEKDKAKAFSYFCEAAEHGNISGMYNAGLMLCYGIGVDIDYEKAASYFRMAAKIGKADAMYELGVLYADGRGVPWDEEQARYWLELAIKFAKDDEELKESAGELLSHLNTGLG